MDDAGRTVQLTRPAERVISLVPSATETLFAIGAGDRVVGRTRYDVADESAHLPSVGGGIDPSLEAVVSLKPDLVVGWSDQNPALRERLEAAGIAVFGIDPEDTTDIFHNIERLGRLTGRDSGALALTDSIRSDLDAVRSSVAGLPRPSVLYIVWSDPPMTIGPETFIAELIGTAGGEILFPEVGENWPNVSMEEIVRRDPDVVVLPVGETPAHSARLLRSAPGWRGLRAVRSGRVVEVPTNLTSRPGPHLGAAARTLRDAIHPRPARR